MCVSLKDVLTTKGTVVETINKANRGGTYISIFCHKVQIPVSPKKDWGCVWYKVSDIYDKFIGYDYFSDEEIWEKNESYRKVEMIFKEDVSTFFRSVLKVIPEECLQYDIASHRVLTCHKLTCGQATFTDYGNYTIAAATDDAREVFVNALLTVERYHPILRANHFLLERCTYSDDNLVKKTAVNFRLRDFYMERIGNATELFYVDFDNLKLTADHLANAAMDSFPPNKQTMDNWRALAERFEYP